MLDKIKKLSSEKGIPILLLEKKCGLSNGSIYHWNTIKPSYDKVVKVAKELGVSIDELVGDS